jgi:hypothetical protein
MFQSATIQVFWELSEQKFHSKAPKKIDLKKAGDYPAFFDFGAHTDLFKHY